MIQMFVLLVDETLFFKVDFRSWCKTGRAQHNTLPDGPGPEYLKKKKKHYKKKTDLRA